MGRRVSGKEELFYGDVGSVVGYVGNLLWGEVILGEEKSCIVLVLRFLQ